MRPPFYAFYGLLSILLGLSAPSDFLSPLLLCSGVSDPGYHLSVGEHPGHHGYREEQEPALSHVLLHLQVSV